MTGDLAAIVADVEVIVTAGSGGVGKTTSSAALALAAARSGRRVVVVTIDPAKRLADALGLGIGGLGDAPSRIDGPWPGELWAAMLDTKASWDDLVSRHAPDRETHDAILANPLYRNLTGRFVQSHDYVAMERLFEIHGSGRYDLVVVDTPPSRHAIDFLDAPERMADFFSSRLLRWLIAPARSRVISAASKPFYTVADRILGSQFLEDIAEFFILFQSMYDGFVERAEAVTRLLSDPRTTFVVVSTLEPAPAREAAYFLDELDRRDLALGAVVLNRVLPSSLLGAPAARVARALAADPDGIASDISGDDEIATTGRVLTEVASSFLNFSVVAEREVDQRTALARRADVVASVPRLTHDVADLSSLLEVGRAMWFEGP